jgi:hypothetical protein
MPRQLPMPRRYLLPGLLLRLRLPDPSSGLLIVAVLAILGGVFGLTSELQAQRPTPPAAGPLWMADSSLDDGRRLLIVVDTASRHAAVYHVDAASGSLTLKSARDLSWDLTLADFNAQEPKPAALKKLLEAGGRP